MSETKKNDLLKTLQAIGLKIKRLFPRAHENVRKGMAECIRGLFGNIGGHNTSSHLLKLYPEGVQIIIVIQKKEKKKILRFQETSKLLSVSSLATKKDGGILAGI